MRPFWKRNDFDIGQTFGIILSVLMIESIYKFIFDLLFTKSASVNILFSSIILYFLAKGMYRHNNTARKWLIGLIYVFTILTYSAPFSKHTQLYTKGFQLHAIENLSFQRWLIFVLVTSPLIVIALFILHSKKAKHEFASSPNA